MNWNQQLETIRWRALEEAGAGSDGWRADIRQEATARTRQDLRAATAEFASAADIDAFLDKRTSALDDISKGRDETLDEERRRMEAPSLRGGWAWWGWALALVFGFGLTGLGADREINLLSLPLVGLLLWNGVVMLGSLVMEFRPARKHEAGWISQWLVGNLTENQGEVSSPAVERFKEFSLPLVMSRAEARGRGWLHLAAAILALGSAVGMYAKGWSREYRAVWESTLLDEPQAARFFAGLFGPAALCFGPEVPITEVPEMRRGSGLETKGVPALPWIHLYAGTLLLWVTLPRIMLAGLAVWSEKSKRAKVWREMGWRDYVTGALREIEGGTEVIEVLVHGMIRSDADQSRWRTALRAKWGGLSGIQFTGIEAGEEDEFARKWVPTSSRSALLFLLAATPEDEVHARLSEEIRARIRTRFPEGRLIVLLDGSTVKDRWDPDKIGSRLQLWSRMLSPASDEIEIIGLNDRVNLLRVAVSEAR